MQALPLVYIHIDSNAWGADTRRNAETFASKDPSTVYAVSYNDEVAKPSLA